MFSSDTVIVVVIVAIALLALFPVLRWRVRRLLKIILVLCILSFVLYVWQTRGFGDDDSGSGPIHDSPIGLFADSAP